MSFRAKMLCPTYVAYSTLYCRWWSIPTLLKLGGLNPCKYNFENTHTHMPSIYAEQRKPQRWVRRQRRQIAEQRLPVLLRAPARWCHGEPLSTSTRLCRSWRHRRWGGGLGCRHGRRRGWGHLGRRRRRRLDLHHLDHLDLGVVLTTLHLLPLPFVRRSPSLARPKGQRRGCRPRWGSWGWPWRRTSGTQRGRRRAGPRRAHRTCRATRASHAASCRGSPPRTCPRAAAGRRGTCGRVVEVLCDTEVLSSTAGKPDAVPVLHGREARRVFLRVRSYGVFHEDFFCDTEMTRGDAWGRGIFFRYGDDAWERVRADVRLWSYFESEPSNL